mgnify:FL=1
MSINCKNKLIKFEDKLKHNENIFEEYYKKSNKISKNNYAILVSHVFGIKMAIFWNKCIFYCFIL